MDAVSSQMSQAIADLSDGLHAEIDGKVASQRDTLVKEIAARIDACRESSRGAAEALVAASEKRMVRKIVTDTTSLIVEQGNAAEDRMSKIEDL